MTVLSWILVETAVIYAGVNSLRYDLDVDARELILRRTEMGAIPRGRGSLREISPHYRDGRENGDGPVHSRWERPLLDAGRHHRREIGRLVRRRRRSDRPEPLAVRHMDVRLSLGPRDRCVWRGRGSDHQQLRSDAQTELRR
jgi:hypothetical protein